MTGVPPPPMSMCQRSLAPPGSHLSGRPVSVDVPFWAGPRQLSHPLTRLPLPAAEALSPRPVSSRPAAATAGNTPLIFISFLLRSHIQTNQVPLVAAAIDPAVGKDRMDPAVAVQHLRAGQLHV